jgi:Spy/CpxP family protein refolding chaperone
MMKGKTWMIAAICAAALPLAALAQVGEGPGHFRGEFRGGGSELLNGVTLSPDQQTAIQQIKQAARAQNKAVFQELRAVEGQIHSAMLASGPVSQAAMTGLQQKASALKAQLDQARLTTELAVRATLTPDQLATAAATSAQLKTLHEQMHSLTHPGAIGAPTAE